MTQKQLLKAHEAGGDVPGPQIVPLIRQLLMQEARTLVYRLPQARSIFNCKWFELMWVGRRGGDEDRWSGTIKGGEEME